MSYNGVMRLAREHPPRPASGTFNVDWLKVVRGCYEEAKRLEGKSFAGAWIVDRVGWVPCLRMLEKYGILRKEGETVRGGRRAYWVMADIEGVEKALRELGYV
jgi:hypothetical protein